MAMVGHGRSIETCMTNNERRAEIMSGSDLLGEGAILYEIVSNLYPICRSITGDGVRQSLQYLGEHVPLVLREVPTGTQVFDWTVPNEWNIREGWIKDLSGRAIVDFKKCNLHVVSYSTPVRQTIHLSELKEHLFSLPEFPEWIPYRTSYYRNSWGFCLSHRQLQALADETYEVCIDASLEPGHLTYGELFIPGTSEEEVLISAHSCHPSLANDNLSGMAVAAGLARHLTRISHRYSYRFVWLPGTIGAITWLALNEASLSRIRHGLVLSCVGDPGQFTYKRSRRGSAEIDRVVEHVLQHSGRESEVLDFSPCGYDERQFCSQGIDLPVGCFMRTPNGRYPQYHTSADDLNLVTAQGLAESLRELLKVVEILDKNCRFLNLSPKCEPQLGRRGLYRQMGGTKNSATEEAMLWVLNLSDGGHSLLDIAERSGLPFSDLAVAATALSECTLLRTDVRGPVNGLPDGKTTFLY